MKKLFILFSILFFLFGCEDIPEKTLMEQDRIVLKNLGVHISVHKNDDVSIHREFLSKSDY